MQTLRHHVWRVAPPLTITYEETDRALAVVEDGLRAICGPARATPGAPEEAGRRPESA